MGVRSAADVPPLTFRSSRSDSCHVKGKAAGRKLAIPGGVRTAGWFVERDFNDALRARLSQPTRQDKAR